MEKILHIKDAYFKIPEKANENVGCLLALLGIYLQREKLTADKLNLVYDSTTDLSAFLTDDNWKCLLSCEIKETDRYDTY